MSSFFAFLDDIAILAKAAAASVDDIAAAASKAASKSVAVVIDDAAVTPQYFQGITPARELPIVWKIAKRSLLNKAIITLAIMVLSLFVPWVFPWALIMGGCYLVYEGVEKIIHRITHGKIKASDAEHVIERTADDEQTIIRSAGTTDFVLSVEIMLIAVDSIGSDVWWLRLSVLIVIALLMTLLVYGAVALLIKIDDLGRWIAERGAQRKQKLQHTFGVGLVKLMPIIFMLLTIIGVAAMLWVGGHLLIVNLAHIGLPFLYDIIHGLTAPITNDILLWFADAIISAVTGICVGLIIVGVITPVKKLIALRDKK